MNEVCMLKYEIVQCKDSEIFSFSESEDELVVCKFFKN